MSTDLIPTAPNLETLILLVTDSVTSPFSKAAYSAALQRFFAWVGERPGGAAFDRPTVQAYRTHLEASGQARGTINQALAAIRKLAKEAKACGFLSAVVAGGIIEVPCLKQHGGKIGHWLNREEARAVLMLPSPNTKKGRRDRALLGLLLGCGLRRTEAAGIQVGQIQERDGRPVIVDLEGKGGRIRTVPMTQWDRERVRAWLEAAEITAGPLLRSMIRGDYVTDRPMTAPQIYFVVRQYAAAAGFQFAPHDLRRTFARLAKRGGADTRKVMAALGHANEAVTERYMGAVDLDDAACDYTGLEEEGGEQ